ncbi:Metalloenzyme, LuxS/M16 peptidase-like protein [Haematococcus lacustris]
MSASSSSSDLKCYRYVKLTNGLTCLLHSDPQMLTPPTESSEEDEGEQEDEEDDEDEDEEGEGVKARRRRGAAGHKAAKKAAEAMAGRRLYVMPAVKDTREVSLALALPCLHPHYGAKAGADLGHLVRHEGPGSLLSMLKARGWATEVCAGCEEEGCAASSACSLCSITLTLTEAGLMAGRGPGLEPLTAAFTFLQLMRSAGPQEWVWQELKAMAEIKFLFQEEEAMDCVRRLAGPLHLVAAQHALCHEFLPNDYVPQLVAGGE